MPRIDDLVRTDGCLARRAMQARVGIDGAGTGCPGRKDRPFFLAREGRVVQHIARAADHRCGIEKSSISMQQHGRSYRQPAGLSLLCLIEADRFGTNPAKTDLCCMAQRNSPVQLSADLGAALIDTSITLWYRWPILLMSALPSRNSAELARMLSEKSAAATSGMIAAQTEAMRIAAAALTGKQTKNPTTATAAAALKPALRTVKANSKRLRRKR
jgi:hypothetical protein